MNRFREDIEEEPELPEEPELKVKNIKPKGAEGSSSAFFKKLFTEGVVTKEAATEMLPFLLFISFLCMLYIANSHMAMKNIRNIDKVKQRGEGIEVGI